MQTQGHKPGLLTQANAVLNSSNSAVMAQLEHMTVTMNSIQAQLKTLTSTQTNQARPKKEFYCWSSARNFTHGSKTWSSNKAVHQEEEYYKKSMRGGEKECEWRLGAIVYKIKISNPKIIFINHINTPSNPTCTNMLAIADSVVNIHLAIQATPKMAPVIMDNKMKSRLPDWSTM